jgi:hypothetical protein
MKEVTKEELIKRNCFNCTHCDQDTTSDVSFCNVCGESVGDGLYYDCYEPEESEELI